MELNSLKSDEGIKENESDHTNEFKQIVEESRENIQAEMLERPTIKRGRGRPRKNNSTENFGIKSPDSNIGDASQVSGNNSTPDLTPYLAPPILLISKIPARKYQIAELAFTQDEAAICAQSLNECLKAFAPSLNQMSPKTAAVLGVCMTFGSIGFNKYQIYLEKRPEIIEPDFQEQVRSEQANSKISGQEYFRKSS